LRVFVEVLAFQQHTLRLAVSLGHESRLSMHNRPVRVRRLCCLHVACTLQRACFVYALHVTQETLQERCVLCHPCNAAMPAFPSEVWGLWSTGPDRRQGTEVLQKAVDEVMTHIVHNINNYKDHIPPVQDRSRDGTPGPLTYPFEINIACASHPLLPVLRMLRSIRPMLRIVPDHNFEWGHSTH
jgi:hypothetical protein